MDPITLALLGGGLGLGLAKSELIDRPAAERQRKLDAAIIRYSPWTGMKPMGVTEANPLGNALQGGLAGGMLGQGLSSAADAKDLNQSTIARNNAQAQYYQNQSPWFQPNYNVQQ